MNKLLKGVIAGSLLLVGAANANAGVITFTGCWSSCTNVGLNDGDITTSVATLTYTANGANTDFTLLNTFGNFAPGNTTAFISELFFNFGATPTGVTNLSANIDSITFNPDFTNASLQFDVDTNLANSGGPGNLRLTHGETATWTFTNFSEANVLTPALVHIQALPNDGSVKFVDGGTIIDNPRGVPEPGLLLLLGTGLMGLGLSRKRKAKV